MFSLLVRGVKALSVVVVAIVKIANCLTKEKK